MGHSKKSIASMTLSKHQACFVHSEMVLLYIHRKILNFH